MELKQVYKNVALFYNNEKFVRETAGQIIVDFERFGIEIHFPQELQWAYFELYKQLLPEIENLLNTSQEKLMALLYAIDVSEAQIKKEAHLYPEKRLAEVITHEILDRDFKKVLTRNYFKSRNDFRQL